MKNAIYILALLLSTSFVLSAQLTEPLSTKKNNNNNNTEYYGHNDYRRGDNSYDSRRDYNYNRRRNDNRYNGDRYDDNRYGNNGRHGGHGHGHGHGNGHGHGHHAGNGHGHHYGGGGGQCRNNPRRHGHRYVGYCNYTNHNYGWRPVSVSVFTGCRQRIRRCSFESDRLREAMFFVDHNYVSAHQIADIMHYFDFESTRLEFAKYAFHRTCDIQNYGVVFGELTFNSSRRELDCYIRDYTW